MRLFAAIALTTPLIQTLTLARDRLLDVAPEWRSEKWVRPEHLHLTVRFFGELDSEVDGLSGALRSACSTVAPYRLWLDGVRAVPSARSARMIWASVAAGGRETATLAASIEQATRSLVGPAGDRAFRSHVTLCRARRPRPLDGAALVALESAVRSAPEGDRAMSVREVTLLASTLTPAGPQYRTVASFALTGD